MENFDIPLWLRIFTLILCALAVFILAARELVREWLSNIAKAALNSVRLNLKGMARRPSQGEISLGQPGALFPRLYWYFGFGL